MYCICNDTKPKTWKWKLMQRSNKTKLWCRKNTNISKNLQFPTILFQSDLGREKTVNFHGTVRGAYKFRPLLRFSKATKPWFRLEGIQPTQDMACNIWHQFEHLENEEYSGSLAPLPPSFEPFGMKAFVDFENDNAHVNKLIPMELRFMGDMWKISLNSKRNEFVIAYLTQTVSFSLNRINCW